MNSRQGGSFPCCVLAAAATALFGDLHYNANLIVNEARRTNARLCCHTWLGSPAGLDACLDLGWMETASVQLCSQTCLDSLVGHPSNPVKGQ